MVLKKISRTMRLRCRVHATSVFFAIALAHCSSSLLSEAVGEDRFLPVNIRQVQVEGEIGRRIDATIQNNLLKIDVEKDFLQPYRNRNQKSGFIGVGSFIDGLVHFAAYSGDEKVLALKRHVISELIKTQAPDGYIGLMVPEARIWELWDIHEMSYIVLGLSADYQFFGEQKSLDAARKVADYMIDRLSAEPERKLDEGRITDHMAMTGIGSALLALHQQTGDARYLDFCTQALDIPDWDYPIVVGRWGPIGGHAYAFLSRCLAQLKIYRLQADEKLLRQSRKALDFLLNQNGLVITGACGSYECWHNTQAGAHNLGETCATAYLVRWLDNWLRLEGDSRFGDVMERAIYNALFAAQSPDGRKIRYYSPFTGPRVYFDLDTYCCPNNYRRIIAELPGMIYYRSDQGVMVNLYTESTATIELDKDVSVRLRQETDYPNSGQVVLHVTPSQAAEFSLQLRIPRWCSQATVSINGGETQTVAPSFHALQRRWESGDRVELTMPMPWRLVKGRQTQAGRVAVMRGPVVFSLNPAQNAALAKLDLRLLTIDPTSLQDASDSPDGLACQLQAWGPDDWYPSAKPRLKLRLTPFPAPEGKEVYFRVPNPRAKNLQDDELLEQKTE